MFLPHFLYTAHRGQSSSGPSPRIITRLNSALTSPDGAKRLVGVYDDFIGVGIGEAVSSNAATLVSEGGAYTTYEDTGGSCLPLVDDPGGVLSLTNDTTDNDEVNIMYGSATNAPFLISDTAGSDYLTVFEARFKLPTISTGNRFIGLTEEARGVTDGLFTDAGALAAIDYIGFYTDENDPDSLNFGYAKAGTDNEQIADIQDLTADTFVKVGFVYDPAAPASGRIKVFVDNVENATKVTATEIATSDFPDGEELTFSAGVKNGTAAASALEIDWWYCFQVRA